MMRTYFPRHHYGVRHEQDGIIHCLGQDLTAVCRYTLEFPESPPRAIMQYTGLAGLHRMQQSRFSSRYQSMTNLHEAFPWKMAVQLGLSMTQDGEPEACYDHAVANDELEGGLDPLARMVEDVAAPLFLRVGYECNGAWNGYTPGAYVRAFGRIAERLGGLSERPALVWCVAAEGNDDESAYSYYPGDDVVDWWGLDLFDAEDLQSPETLDFLARAHAHGKPVMIGEATPRRVGVDRGDESWQDWFEPYFDLLATQPGIKMSSYINWDWTGRGLNETSNWSDWGNGRLECNPVVRERWRRELADPVWRCGDWDEAGLPRTDVRSRQDL
jgi:hypothetical protein